jgi:hypothetical protein
MKLNHTRIGIVILCLLLLSACSSPADDNNTLPDETQGNLIDKPANSAEPTPPGDYWDASDFPGQSVYSLTFGISQAAHDAFSACHLPEVNIEHAVETFLQQQTERQIITAQNSQHETLWSVAIDVASLTADVYQVTCTKLQ